MDLTDRTEDSCKTFGHIHIQKIILYSCGFTAANRKHNDYQSLSLSDWVESKCQGDTVNPNRGFQEAEQCFSKLWPGVQDRKSTRLKYSHIKKPRMPSSA